VTRRAEQAVVDSPGHEVIDDVALLVCARRADV
jgi:hypothetical protein